MTKFINDLPNLEFTFLRAQFRYEPETGLLTWIAKRQGVRTGTFAGRQRHAADSAHVALNKHQYPVELLVWAIHRGTWPSHVPYHIDRNRLNNRIDNLALPVGANQVKPLRKRSMAVLQARIDDQYNIDHNVRPAPARMTATDIAVALAPRKRNNRGRKAATVAVTLTETSEVPKTALEAMRILLQDTEARLDEQRSDPPDMHPAPENIAGRAAVIEYTRKLANIEGRIEEMQRKIAMMEEQDAQNPMTTPTDAQHQPIKGLSTLQGLFAKALQNTPHRGAR